MRNLFSRTKKIISYLLVSVLTLSIIIPANFAVNAQEPEAISWGVDSETKKLTISGNGNMDALLDYESGGCPWAEYAGEIEEIYIEEGITTICTMAFCDMGNLKNVSIPSTVEYIDEYAFANCSVLEEITISDGVKELANNAFYSCTSLKIVRIGKSLADIGFNFTWQHGSVENFYVNAENPVYSSENGVLFNKNKTELIVYPVGNTRDTYNIPEGVEIIAVDAFANAKNLQKIKLPESIKEIGINAFGNTGFYTNKDNWTNEALYIEENLIAVDRSLVSGTYEIKDGTKLVAGGALSSCNLSSISIPETLTSIGDYAFSTNLSEIVLDKNNSSFVLVNGVLFTEDMKRLVCYPSGKTEISYIIPNGVEILPAFTFYRKPIAEITFPEGLKEIGEQCFGGCANLKKIVLPDSLISIGEAAFMYCSGIESVDFGNGLVSIDDYAFSYCSNLASVSFDDGIETIGRQCFNSCTKIGKVVIPGSIKLIETGAFVNSGVTELVIGADPETENYSSVNVEPSETVIKSQAFGGTPIASAVLNVKEISFSAFIGCENLETLVLFDGIKEIGFAAFSDCRIKDVYYYGTSEDLEDIIIANSNETLLEADWHIMHKKAETNGVIATYPADCFGDEEAVLLVDDLNGSSDKINSGFYEMEGMKRIGLYSIKTVNSKSETIQPKNGKVTIKLPISTDVGENDMIVIYHLFSDGGREKFTTTPQTTTDKLLEIIDGYFVFEVDHFSEFVIYVEEPILSEKTVSSVSIVSLPAKTSYIYRMDNLDLSGLALTVTYSDGTTETVADTSKMKVTGFDNSKTGTQTVTVEYEGATSKFDVTVSYAWWQWIIRILLLGFLWY